MNFHTVFSKTQLGHREIERRSHALDARHRTLLILIDGQRSVGALGDLLGHGGNLAPMLTQLTALGLVSNGVLPEPPEDLWAASSELATRRLSELLHPEAGTAPASAASTPASTPRSGLLARCRSLVADAGRRRSAGTLERGT